MWFLTLLLYILLVIGLLLYLAGVIGGGLKNEETEEKGKPKVGEAEPGAVAKFLGGITAAFNGIGDKVRSAGSVMVIIASAALTAINLWQGGSTFSTLFWVVAFGALTAIFLFDLYSTYKQKARRGRRLSTLIWVGIIAFVTIVFVLVSGFKNNRAWYQTAVRTQDVTVGAWTETVRYVKTPNLKYLDATDWDDNPCATNPDLSGYEFQCKNGKFQLRAQIAKPHSVNAASGEYDSLEDIVLAHRQLAKERADRAAQIEGKAQEKKDETKKPDEPKTLKEDVQPVCIVAGGAGVLLLLAHFWRTRRKGEKPACKPATTPAGGHP